MDDESTRRLDRTMFLPAVAVPPIPQAGGAEVVAIPAHRGDTAVTREVVEKIASAAARSVPGVAELGGDIARLVNSMLDKIGLDEVGDATRGVTAKVDGTSVFVTVVLVLRAGEVVADVMTTVRTRVIEALENYGLLVTGVNVKVDDIRMP
jgi:uncharacterized alkaline shock family protein YloU